jgi:hypothetical protein
MGDAEVYFHPWPFDLGKVQHEIRYWHGAKDRNIPLFRVQQWTRKIAGAALHSEPELGHFSVAILRAAAALDYLAGK